MQVLDLVQNNKAIHFKVTVNKSKRKNILIAIANSLPLITWAEHLVPRALPPWAEHLET